MRFEDEEEPKQGEFRTIRKFLFLPLKIGKVTR